MGEHAVLLYYVNFWEVKTTSYDIIFNFTQSAKLGTISVFFSGVKFNWKDVPCVFFFYILQILPVKRVRWLPDRIRIGLGQFSAI